MSSAADKAWALLARLEHDAVDAAYSQLKHALSAVLAELCVVIADSPEDAVQRAHGVARDRWQVVEGVRGPIDSVTERRKNGKAYSVEDDGRCVEVEDLPW